MYTIEQIRELRHKCFKYKLENREILETYTNEELQEICNGIGPEFFPQWLRDMVTAMHPSLAPDAFIHDVEYAESDGSRSGFESANERFKRNGYLIAKAEYGWYNPRRYIVMNQARRFGNYCNIGGWLAWKQAEKDDK